MCIRDSIYPLREQIFTVKLEQQKGFSTPAHTGNHLNKSIFPFGDQLVQICLLYTSTFAWFTDSVSSSGNRIQAGTLNITATAAGYDQNGSTQITVPDGVIAGNTLIFGAAEDIEAEGAKPVISESNWEPGQRNAKLLTVANSGSLAAKIKLEFNVTNGELTDALWFDFIQVKMCIRDRCWWAQRSRGSPTA